MSTNMLYFVTMLDLFAFVHSINFSGHRRIDEMSLI